MRIGPDDEPPASFVVDAGVGLKLVLPEPLADGAAALFGLLALEPTGEFHIPDLFYVECANKLWKYVRRGALAEVDAVGDMRRLRALMLCPISTADVVEEALRLAVRHDLHDRGARRGRQRRAEIRLAPGTT